MARPPRGLLSAARASLTRKVASWLPDTFLKKLSGGQTFDVYSSPAGTKSKYGLIDRQGNTKEMLEAFRSVVFACVNVRAKEVANRLKFRLNVRVGPDEFEPAPLDHPLLQLLERPNPNFTPWFWKYLTIAYLDLSGNSYHWIARDRMNVPRSLWPLPSHVVRIIPGDPSVDGRLIKSYLVDWGQGNKVEVDADDILHLRYPDPVSPYYYGGSLLMRAAYEVDIAKFILDYQREFFANDAMPALVVLFKEQLNKDTREEFEDKWVNKFRRKPGQVGWLEGDATIKEVLDSKEMHYIESNQTNAKRIQAVFGVPDSKIMISETVDARATLETMDYAFQKETIDPLLRMLAEQLTYDLANVFYGPDLVVDYVSTIPKDMKLQAELDNLRVDKIQTANEIRKRDGLEPLPGGDHLVRTFRDIPMEQLSAQVVENRSGGAGSGGGGTQSLDEPGREKELSESRRRSLWLAHSKIQIRWEVRLTRALKKYYREIEKEVLSNLRSGKSLQKDRSDEAGARAEALLFDVEAWLEKLRELVGEQATAIMQAAFDEFVDSWALDGVIFAPRSNEVQRAIAELNAKTVSVPAELHADLLKEFTEGIRLNETTEELAARISKFFNNVVDYRSIRIARTVSNYAINEGNRLAARESGLFTHKTWITQRDDRVRDLHRDLDGVEVAFGEKFALANGDKLDVPGDPRGQAESVINCFPAGTLVAAGKIEKGYRAPYSGELITIRTSRGYKLTGTPNHPILTPTGFVPLGELVKGGRVLCSPLGERMLLSDPNIKQRPLPIEEVFDTLSYSGNLQRIAPLFVNFYGDRPTGYVDIVRSDRELESADNLSFRQPLREENLSGSDLAESAFSGSGFQDKLSDRSRLSASGAMRGVREELFLFEGEGGHSNLHRSRTASRFESKFIKPTDYPAARNPEVFRNLLNRLTGAVSPDQIVAIDRFSVPSIHVYTLQTDSGIYAASDGDTSAYGIVTSNCRCTAFFTKGVTQRAALPAPEKKPELGPALPPITIHVHVPEHKTNVEVHPANVTVQQPDITIEQPAITVEAPKVEVNVPERAVTVKTEPINVDVRLPAGGGRFSVARDEDGNIKTITKE